VKRHQPAFVTSQMLIQAQRLADLVLSLHISSMLPH
jgi:hypothetical protein